MNERKPAPLPPPPVAVPDEDAWDGDEGDRPTMSIPAAVLAEIYQRPPSSPPPSMPASVPTNGLERMIITDAMLGRVPPQPKMPTKTAKMTTMPAKPEKK